LGEYVDVEDKDIFTYWVETKMRDLGSMKGLPGSIKFGIYRRKRETNGLRIIETTKNIGITQLS
jgi:hypothetical protein